MAKVVLEEVNKVYPNGFHAVHDLSIDIDDSEFLVLVGPSGCGKSTALRMIAGLESISSGKLMIGDRVVNDVPPKDRDIAFVFQNYALYPHMTVKENIGFALKLRRMSKDEIEQRVKEAAELLELTPVLDRKPGQLSGGQRQRVAMGRAIVRRPHVFLMDEPLSNLDAKLRVQMRAEISRLQHNLGVTTVYVTHDQVEAMTMGHRVAVLDAGYLQQIDTPQNLYDHPNNLFVATFIGSPQMNLVLGKVDLSGPSVDLGKHRLDLPAGVLESRPGLRQFDGAEVIVGIRPEDMEDATVADAAQGNRTLPVKILLREGLGSEVVVHAQLDARAPQVKTAQAGDDSGVLLEGSGVAVIARLDPRTKVAIDQEASFVVDVERLHWFDPGTGLAIYD